ncbi:MAG: aminotransferase class V-fold PLP-dependent enzyme [Gemmatimonadetes bacterium]|nr:aminotransferase class V-fold PLP-dependent enzyme [Gemmatimonadota bacterium]NNM04880.1 aminotransferase class V-fold PLP-dependent enzyme [Gemmatimonadota bacterium]
MHYLNCAYMSPLPRAVEEAGVLGIYRKRNPASLGPEDFFSESQEARGLFARLVNVPDPDSVAIIPSVSYGVSVAARNTPLASGQNVVLLEEQFPGNVYAWLRLAGESGGEVRMVGPGDKDGSALTGSSGRGRRWNERILEAMDGDTGIVALAPVHWTDGTRFDLEAISSRAREVGAALIIDGTQAVGAMPFDVQALEPDALIVASYKWLFGPYSIGLAYFGPRYREGTPLEETWIAREGSEDFRALVDYRDRYQPGSIRFDVGERSNFILVPMMAEALRLLQEWEPGRIQDYAKGLSAEILAEAEALGYTTEEEAHRVGHIFGVRTPEGLEMARLSEALRDEGVSASLRGSALRVSPNLYNDQEDVAALNRALRAALD